MCRQLNVKLDHSGRKTRTLQDIYDLYEKNTPFLEYACTMCLQCAEVAERSLQKELFTVLISGCFFPVCQQFSVMIFILLLLCSKVNLCVCKNGAFTQIVLLTGSSFEMQHQSHSSVLQLLKEKSSGRLWKWI